MRDTLNTSTRIPREPRNTATEKTRSQEVDRLVRTECGQ